MDLYRRFAAAGASVRAYDPQAADRARSVEPALVCAADPYDAAHHADALIISTDWDEFTRLDWMRIYGIMARPTIFDGRNLLSPREMNALGFEYHSIGRPA